MGLDVYLYRYENKQDTESRESEYESESEKIWGIGTDYDKLSESKKESLRTQCRTVANRLNLDDDGSDRSGKKQIEVNSAKYPAHLFKIGYFRSSYNEGGIHHKLSQAGAMSLDEICGYDGEYCFQPDWLSVKSRCEATIAKLREFSKSVGGRLVTFIDAANFFTGPREVGDRQAMEIYRLELEKRNSGNGSGFESYSNGSGTFFFHSPLSVVAAVPGKSALGTPGVYLIYGEENSDGFDWYINAIEIIAETCDYVLSQPDSNKFWLHWSSK
jgi:hypothetical protein